MVAWLLTCAVGSCYVSTTAVAANRSPKLSASALAAGARKAAISLPPGPKTLAAFKQTAASELRSITFPHPMHRLRQAQFNKLRNNFGESAVFDDVMANQIHIDLNRVERNIRISRVRPTQADAISEELQSYIHMAQRGERIDLVGSTQHLLNLVEIGSPVDAIYKRNLAGPWSDYRTWAAFHVALGASQSLVSTEERPLIFRNIYRNDKKKISIAESWKASPDESAPPSLERVEVLRARRGRNEVYLDVFAKDSHAPTTRLSIEDFINPDRRVTCLGCHECRVNGPRYTDDFPYLNQLISRKPFRIRTGALPTN